MRPSQESCPGRRSAWAVVLTADIALLALAYALQTYRFTSLEESYIFLFDRQYIVSTLCRPGGAAQLAASFLTQFMIYAWTGPLITAAVYFGIMASLLMCSRRPGPLIAAAAAVPCMCLMLCLENTAYDYQGHIAVLMSSLALRGYAAWGGRMAPPWRAVAATGGAAVLYFAAGSAALFAGAAMWVYDIAARRPRAWAGIVYPLAAAAEAWICCRAGLTYTPETAFTPAMYYDLNATFYMMLYALAALPLCMALAAWLPGRRMAPSRRWIAASVVLVVALAATLNVFSMIHSRAVYENQQMRYYALRGRWSDIAAMPYDGSATPFTSYRFLALACLGSLDSTIWSYNPFIDYFFRNKPLVKKMDQQMLSDLYYQCDYMGAARHAAFDTDIVTPGEFNPAETAKLVTIHLAYGNYRVAEKLIAGLEKTMFYSSWASGMRRFLDADSLVEADPVLGPKRRAIPPVSHYISPKGLQRELESISAANPGQTAARQFLNAFMILTHQK